MTKNYTYAPLNADLYCEIEHDGDQIRFWVCDDPFGCKVVYATVNIEEIKLSYEGKTENFVKENVGAMTTYGIEVIHARG